MNNLRTLNNTAQCSEPPLPLCIHAPLQQANSN